MSARASQIRDVMLAYAVLLSTVLVIEYPKMDNLKFVSRYTAVALSFSHKSLISSVFSKVICPVDQESQF